MTAARQPGRSHALREGPHGLPRLLAGLHSPGGPLSGAEHEALHGPLPALGPRELIGLVHDSGLRGRGGADFPTARKLQAVAERRRVSAVVVNGSETEPASRKDALLLSRLPHLVLDGAALAAIAVGTSEVFVKVPADATRSVRALEQAVGERRDGRVRFTLAAGPEGYVTGEETAVINHLGGGPSVPLFVPPRPFERGYRGRPTLIQNVETLAQMALIARYGAEWFRELGTATDPGTVLVTISGAVAAPGVYELAFGTSMQSLIAAAGGATDSLQALLIGGYFGTWVGVQEAMELQLSREDLQHMGAALGSGVVIALGEAACGLRESARVFDYLARQSAGQCGPCVHGLRAMADGVSELAAGRTSRDQMQRLQRWAGEVKGRGACHHPDGAVRFIQSALTVFSEEIERHQHGRCGGVPAGLPLGRPVATAAGRRT